LSPFLKIHPSDIGQYSPQEQGQEKENSVTKSLSHDKCKDKYADENKNIQLL
jgi:hypothetical protein